LEGVGGDRSIEMVKRIIVIWLAVQIPILIAGMVSGQEPLQQTDRKSALTYDEPSGPARLLYEQAKKFWQAGDYAKAAEVYSQITRLRPKDFLAYSLQGFANSKAGRNHEALKAFKEAVRLRPDFAANYLALGEAYGKLDRHQEAIEAFKQAIRLKPDDASAHLQLGTAYGDLASSLVKRGQYDKGIEFFKQCAAEYKQAIRLKPDDARAHFGLGMSYLIQGDRGAALEEYKILKNLDKERANVLFNNIYK
jgi:tetratricopeptide (TPR) repeat protein